MAYCQERYYEYPIQNGSFINDFIETPMGQVPILEYDGDVFVNQQPLQGSWQENIT